MTKSAQFAPRVIEIVTEVTGIEFTLEQRMEVVKRVAVEYGGTKPYVGKQVPQGFVTAFMERARDMPVVEMVKLAKGELGVSRRTVYRWIGKK